MSGFSWDQNSESGRGIPSDVSGTPAPVPAQFAQQPQQQLPQAQAAQSYEQPAQMTPDEEEEYYNNLVLSDARLRLVQGSLYEKIMTHNIFEGYDADPIAIRNVEREIKKYARERMEIMLGMRAERQVAAPPAPSAFNELEISILKSLASKASKGATETPEANKLATWNQPQKLNTISSKPNQSLSPIAKPAPSPQTQTTPPPQPVQQAPAPVEEKVSDGPPKLLQEMTEAERQAHFERNRQKYKPVKAQGTLPMPTAQSEAMGYMAQAAQLSKTLAPHEQSLLNLINSQNK